MNPKLILPQRYRLSYLSNKQRMREQEGCLEPVYYGKRYRGCRRRASVIAGGSLVTLWCRGGSAALLYKPVLYSWSRGQCTGQSC
jgi:hypothetical protein